MSLLEEAFWGAGWDESLHPRNPGGSPEGGRFSPKTVFLESAPSTLGHEGQKRVPWIYGVHRHKLYVGSPGSDHMELKRAIKDATGDDTYEEWNGAWVPGERAELHGDDQGNMPSEDNALPDDLRRLIRKDLRAELVKYDEGEYQTASVWAEVAAGWDESKHPRDPGGEEGGQFIEKGTSAEGATMGLGSAEERAAAEAQWANVPDWTKRDVQGRLREFMSEADLQMRVPEGALLEVLNDGKFMNQHESNVGRGMPRGVEQEARIFGVEASPEALPKYGYLGPDNSQTNYYGPIRVVFNDNVKDRTTFTFDDSLIQNMGPVAPSPVRDPQLLSINPSVAFTSDENFSTSVSDLWYQVQNEMTPYVEAQIWGELTPDDIAYVEIPDPEYWEEEDPNTGYPLVDSEEEMDRVIAELDKRGIRWSNYIPEGDFSGEWA